MKQSNKKQTSKHHITQFQNNLILKDDAQKILNLKRATEQKIKSTCETRDRSVEIVKDK
jgi:hypothetical protein